MRNRLALLLILLAIVAVPYYSPPKAHAQTTFSFGVAGDYGYTSNNNATQTLFTKMGQSGLDFAIALGDLSYGETSPQTWCGSFKGNVDNLEIMTGNHDSGETSNPNPGDNLNFFDTPSTLVNPGRQRYCHFTLPGGSAITGLEGMEYYFDYPAAGPLVRIISISAGITFQGPVLNNSQSNPIRLGASGCSRGPGCYDVWSGLRWSYVNDPNNVNQDLDHYNWVSNAIDDARTANIPLVFLTMHKNCLTTGGGSSSHITCESGSDIMNLAISKKIDLYVTGHEHNYERSKQLAFNGSTCTAIQSGTYNSACVVSATSPFIKGAGTIVLTVGTGGEGMGSYGCNSGANNQWSIPQYFLQCQNASFGFVKFSVTGSSLSASFVASSGSYSDSFNIADFTVASVTSISFHKNCILQDTLTATALNGFTSDITLSYTDPSGRVSLIFSPNPVNPQGTFAESTMTYHGNPEGTYVITVIGTSGVIVHSYLVTVTITPPGVCPVLPP